jgi:hypothetical protein
MRSAAARHQDTNRTLLLMAPGWIRTELGGPEARLTTDEIKWLRRVVAADSAAVAVGSATVGRVV